LFVHSSVHDLIQDCGGTVLDVRVPGKGCLDGVSTHSERRLGNRRLVRISVKQSRAQGLGAVFEGHSPTTYGQNFYFNGSLQIGGGTSIVAPELAGFFAQENAYLLYGFPGSGVSFQSNSLPGANGMDFLRFAAAVCPCPLTNNCGKQKGNRP
jgi:hypothetical protein